ncbi:MAG: NHL repeat-containing protein, partial [Planctomycetota bacterium]
DGSGNVYVADTGNFRVSVWDTNGNALYWIGGNQDGQQTGPAPTAASSDYRGFDRPEGVCVDGNGNIYVADYNNNRIAKWDGSGNAVGWIGGGQDGWQTGNVIVTGGAYREFDLPSDVAVCARGYIYVADTFNYRISKWAGNGVAVGWIGAVPGNWQTGPAPTTWGTDYRTFHFTYSVHVDANRNIFVADANNRICKWTD